MTLAAGVRYGTPHPTLRGRRQLVAVLLACGVALLSGCQVSNFGAPDGATTQSANTHDLWQGEVITALAVGALVWGLIFFVVLRYRRRSDATPSQRAYVIPLEILYTVIPLVMVAVIFGFTFKAQNRVNAVSAHPDVRVEVTAFKWGWRFHYPAGDVTVISNGSAPPVLVLPAHETSEITLVSSDVVHSFYVPGFLFQRNAIPGIVNKFDFNITKVGDYIGRCTSFCGLRHYQMLFTVRAVSAGDYQRWLATQSRAAGSPS